MIEPPRLARRPTTTLNPFKRDGTSTRLIKRVSRAISHSATPSGLEGGGGGSSTIPSTRAPVELAPLSPTLSMPPLSPCPSYSSSTSSSSSVRRKPIPTLDASFSSTSSSSSSILETSEGDSDDEDEPNRDTLSPGGEATAVVIEVVDGLWTSTVDERIDWPLPAWYYASSVAQPSKTNNRLARLGASASSSKARTSKPRRDWTKSPVLLDLEELSWLPSLLSSDESALRPFGSEYVEEDKIQTSSSPARDSPATPTVPSSQTRIDTHTASRSSTPLSSSRQLSPGPDRASLWRIESGGRPLVFNAGNSHSLCAFDFEEVDDDEEEVLVIRLPPAL
ncbi:hypothetical protein JCM3766R1_000886 [Sporobolomyces carnicolor]